MGEDEEEDFWGEDGEMIGFRVGLGVGGRSAVLEER